MHKLLTCTTLLGSVLHVQAQTAEQDHPAANGRVPQAESQRVPFGAEDTTTIHIRLLNGKTGQPIADKDIFLERNKTHLMSHAEEHDITTDRSGRADATVPKTGDVLNPVVVDYKSCTPRRRHGDDRDKSVRFPIAQVLTTGVVAENTCGTATQRPTPGELTLYFRTRNVFERITD